MKVFLSYSLKDRELANEVAARLAKAGFEVWSADRNLFPGDHWHAEIAEALEQSEAMVVLVSPASMQSESVRAEINFALTAPQYAGRLIPVVVRPTEEMPWILGTMPVIRVGRSRADLGKRIAEQLESVPK